MPYDGSENHHLEKGHGGRMSTTLAIDDELLAEAQRLTGLTEKSDVIR